MLQPLLPSARRPPVKCRGTIIRLPMLAKSAYMEISYVEYQPGVVLVTVKGRVLLSTGCDRIESEAIEWIDKGYRKFIFEVGEVTHIDSTGIGRFIALLNRLMPLGGQLRIANAHGVFRDSFRVTRLDTVFQFYPDVESAAQSFS